MGKSRQVRIDESLIDAMGRIGRPIAEKIKRDYNLTTLEIGHPTLSSILAGKLNKQKTFNFRIQKISRDKGKLILM